MYKEESLKEAALMIAEKLKVSDGLGAWITDFQKSDAPQFASKSDEDKKKMAIAAFTDAGGKLDEAMDTWKVTVVKAVNKLKKGQSVSVKANNIPQALKKSAKEFGDSNLIAVPSTHFKVQKEEVELDEAVKYQYVAIDRLGKVIGFASDERDAKDMATRGHTMDSPSKGKGVVGRNKAKVVKLKKPMSDKTGDMMINRDFDIGKYGDKTVYSIGLGEEEEPNKPDSAKAVDQSRDDKKKTRIAQLQLQIAKASETINKLNAQEKPNE
jgi:hypothetical protein